MDTADEKGLVVVPGTWDDLGAILDDLGFSYSELSKKQLEDSRHLANCHVLFVACGAGGFIRGLINRWSSQAVENVRNFVAEGGALYASDLISALIESAFPGKVQFSDADYDSEVAAEVVDPGLVEILGPTMALHFDCALHGITKVQDESVRVYLQGKYRSSDEDIRPLLVSFNHGEGQVIYTTFHNSVQVSEEEQKLLRFLVFQPMLAGAAKAAARAAQAQQATPGKEIIASIDPGAVSNPYVLTLQQPTTVLYVLSWQGRGTLGMLIRDPRGQVYRDETSSVSPFTVEVPNAMPGQWGCQVKGVGAPHPNFPYVLTLATQTGVSGFGQTARPAAVAPQPFVTPQPVVVPQDLTPGRVPVYFVVDCSSAMGMERASAVNQALRELAKGLRSNAEMAERVRMSLIPVGMSGARRTPLTAVKQFSFPPLQSSGALELSGGLQALLDALVNDQQEGTRDAKPLVFVLLAGAPADGWRGQGQAILEKVERKEANVIVVGVGRGVPTQAAQGMTQVPLLEIAEPTADTVQEFFGWVDQSIRSLAEVAMAGTKEGTFNLPPLPSCVQVGV